MNPGDIQVLWRKTPLKFEGAIMYIFCDTKMSAFMLPPMALPTNGGAKTGKSVVPKQSALFTGIKNLFKDRADAKTQYEIDRADLTIDYLQNIPLGDQFTKLYANETQSEMANDVIANIIRLASAWDKNEAEIHGLCELLDAVSKTNRTGISDEIVKILTGFPIENTFNMVLNRQLDMYEVIHNIQELKDADHRGRLIDLVDGYMLSLALAGPSANNVHNDRYVITLRKPAPTTCIALSIGDPEFNAREFFSRGPMSMFYESRNMMGEFRSIVQTLRTQIRSSDQVVTSQAVASDEPIERLMQIDRFVDSWSWELLMAIPKIHNIPTKSRKKLPFYLAQKFSNADLNIIKLLTRIV